ncbi:MAG: helix-turn-helix transcriptional regulator [Elusimicrobiota bacterium]
MKNRLKVLRAERNWTQEELGKRVGVSRQAINALETEKHDRSIARNRFLAEAAPGPPAGRGRRGIENRVRVGRYPA